MKLLGIDGTKKGWCVVVVSEGQIGLEVWSTFAALLNHHSDAAAVAVDIPVGLTDGPDRLADIAVRELVGPLYRSVFTTPCREALMADSHAAANTVSKQVAGKGVSAQAFALRHKILEVDAFAQRPELFEVHPEGCFCVMNGAPLRGTKRSWSGATQRLQLLERQGFLPPVLHSVPTAIPFDDVLDAAAAAWTAGRLAAGSARRLPSHEVQLDPHTKREIAVWA